MPRTVEQMIRNPLPRHPRKVDKPCNEAYYKLCEGKGKDELREILREHDLAIVEAQSVIIR